MTVQIGAEVLLRERIDLVKGAKVGAVVHPASVFPSLQHTADVLLSEGQFRLISLFGPQHGARGEKQDNMIESEFYRDPDTQLPVHSLYGAARRPTSEMLDGLDILLYDLQDVGTRVYTFIHTMAYCMEACARSGKRMIVLDRPNPINGVQIEGNLLSRDYTSFVGLYPIPMRHGMTVGELALLFNSEFNIGCDLTVVAMKGWRRSYWFDDTGLPWVAPSPNIPTLDSATVYPGMVLLEGTQLSEGRGTTRPFEIIGAPYIQPRQYATCLGALNLPGVFFRPAYFEPTFQKWKGIICGGVQVHVKDRSAYEPYLTGIMTISVARSLYPANFRWRDPPYEYEYEKLPIEILCGGREIAGMIEKDLSPDQFRHAWQGDVAGFARQREAYLLYE
ncbi:MAG TPA: DUF1343 domain-containing protein [Acidobacteriota bacterium]|nr:DUF1343 domain-containing protein [Acidobacteriota bacterium]